MDQSKLQDKNMTTLARKVAGKVRSAQRVKFRRLMGSMYNRDQKRWKDSPEVREFLKLADSPPTILHPAKEGTVQKYALGCSVNYTKPMSNKTYSGKIIQAKLFYSNITQSEDIEYLISSSIDGYHRLDWIYQHLVTGLLY